MAQTGYATSVGEIRDGGFSVTVDSGWSFWMDAQYAGKVKEGDWVYLFGKGIGFQIQGVAVNGTTLWYKTNEQMEAEHKAWCDNHDREKRERLEANRNKWLADIAALPDPLRLRMERFMSEKEDFLKDSGEYELFCCTEAVKVMDYIKAQIGDDASEKTVKDAINAFKELPWEEQAKVVSDGHSGNSFDFACMLAYCVLNGKPV